MKHGLLRDTNEELNTFIYKATHDLKGPISSILGLINVAHADVQDKNALEYINLIGTSAKKLDTILNDLLRISVITHSTPCYTKVNVGRVVEFVKDSVKRMPYSQNVDIVTNINVSQQFSTDEQLLTSVLHNLLDNAVKYKNSRENNPFAKIEAMNHEEGLQITISDNGCGTPLEMQPQLFNMFFRGNENSNGPGLGLYMVKKAVEKLNGEIKFNSVAGVGSTFVLQIPNSK